MRVLIVENEAVASTLQRLFAVRGLRIEAADTGEDALKLLRHYEFDIVVLDLALPDMEGTRMIRRIRGSGLDTPILALYGPRNRHEVPAAFAAGADDAIDTAIDLTELIARMHAIIRRTHGHSQSILQVGGLTLDLQRREVTANGTALALTGKEFELLQLLMLRKNLVLTKGAILNQLYGGLDEPGVEIVSVFVSKLRKKLAQAGLKNVIGTVWGRGYTIDVLKDESRTFIHRPPKPASETSRGLSFVPARFLSPTKCSGWRTPDKTPASRTTNS